MKFTVLSHLVVAALCSFLLSSCDSDSRKVGKEQNSEGYKFILRERGKETFADSSILEVSRMVYATKTTGGDTLISSSYDEPYPLFIDLRDSVFRQMTLIKILSQKGKIGDSLTLFIPSDTVFKDFPRPAFVKEGADLRQEVRIVRTLSSQEYDDEVSKIREEQMKKMMEQQAEQQRLMKEMEGKEDSVKTAQITHIETEYLPSKGIKNFKKTDSGLFYVIDKQGENSIKAGDNVKVHYEGTILGSGEKFDSSYDRNQPIEFPIGQGQVIAGWDEGIPLIGKGGKGTLYIPAHLAYGPRQMGEVIKPFSMLVFKVEVVE